MILNLRELIAGALSSAGLQTTSDVWQLAEAWSLALGTPIATKATPVRLVRGELVVAVAEAVWRQELALLAPQLISRLNHVLGRDVVQRMRFIGGDAPPMTSSTDRDRPRRRLPSVSTAVPENAAPRKAAAAGGDVAGELDTALRSLAAKRAERIVADAAPSAPESAPRGAARPRKRW